MYVKNNFFLNIFRQLTSKYKSSDFNRLNVFQRGVIQKDIKRSTRFHFRRWKKKNAFRLNVGFSFFFYFLQNWITG